MQISPWKQHRQKKQSRPWRSQRKNPQNCHLRFLIFETLSQRFFAAKLGFFQFFQKRQKEAILFCKFLHENWADRKNGVHHDKANGKSFETVISDFWILKLRHRDISPQSSLLLASRLDKQTFCGKFLVARFFCNAKKILSKFFVRAI